MITGQIGQMDVLSFEVDIGVSGGRKCGMLIVNCTTSSVAKGTQFVITLFKSLNNLPLTRLN